MKTKTAHRGGFFIPKDSDMLFSDDISNIISTKKSKKQLPDESPG
jgi:hypothetical protein